MEKGDAKLFSAVAVLLAIMMVFSVYGAKAACRDGKDNDSDSRKDYPQDSGCSSKEDNNEKGSIICDDGIDNDGDGKTDYTTLSTSDAGCSFITDTDETNCGDGAVSGAEVCDGSNLNGKTCATQGFDGGTLSCSSTCLSFVTTSCWTNSCADTDGGQVYGTKGTVSGNYQGSSYSNADSCSGTVLTEYFCNGKLKSNNYKECNAGTNTTNSTNGTTWTGCSNGACY